MRLGRASALLALVLTLAADTLAAQPPANADRVRAIAIDAQPISDFDHHDPSRRTFGSLVFRGGLALTSPDASFGGLSAIHVADNGEEFVALSDKGQWLTGRIVYDRAVPTAIVNARMAPVLAQDGRPIRARGWYDTEAIAEADGVLYVGLERVHKILTFEFAKYDLVARGQPLDVPPAFQSLTSNKGIEGLVFVANRRQSRDGDLIAFSERSLNDDGNIRGFLLGDRQPGEFAVKRTDEFDVSDATLLAPDAVLVLERRFSFITGAAVRLRRIPLADIQPGATVDGPVMFFADLGYAIDNMEGLSVHNAADGSRVVTMISDDNFSSLQRTLLLQFTLIEK